METQMQMMHLRGINTSKSVNPVPTSGVNNTESVEYKEEVLVDDSKKKGRNK